MSNDALTLERNEPVTTATPAPQPPTARRPKLDEPALRRPEFVPGSPVTLADGQTWFLRRPVMRFVPDDTHDSGFQARLSLEGDDLYGELMKRRDSLFDADGSADIAALIGVELAIGRLLLLANYDLGAGQIASILQFSYDADEDPEGFGIRQSVIDVALGRGPKASPAGLGS